MILRDYQLKAEEDFVKFYNNKTQKGLLVAPVGTGKSIYPALFAKKINKKCLCIQPSIELLEQNLAKANQFGLSPTVYSSSISRDVSHLTYATVQSLYNREQEFKDFDLVIIDECHQKMTNTLARGKVQSEGKINEFLKEINPKKIIGMTATPIQLIPPQQFGGSSSLKMINHSKRSFWQRAEIFHITQIQDIAQKYWSHIEYRDNKVDSSYLQLNSTGSEFTDESIREAYKQNNTSENIVKKYEQLKSEGKRSILTFVPSIIEGEELANKMKGSYMISSHTDKNERKELITAFKNFEIDHLINCQVLTTGFDHPGLDAIICGRETNSFSLYYQIIGRLVRPIIVDGQIIKTESIFEDLTGNFKRFGKIEDITFEQDKFTTIGWNMWNNNELMTSSSFVKSKRQEETQLILNNSYSIKFTFGKFKGIEVDKIAKEHKWYIKWLLENKEFNWDGKSNIREKLLSL